MNYTQSLGYTIECACVKAFMELGYTCLSPIFGDAKYDFVVDTGEQFLKIQCKTASFSNALKNSFVVRTITHAMKGNKMCACKYNEGDLDYFATFVDGNVYIIPFKECLGKSITLRLSTKQNCYSHKAEDYLLTKVFLPSREYLKTKEKCPKPLHNTPHCPICGAVVSREGNICRKCYMKKHNQSHTMATVAI